MLDINDLNGSKDVVLEDLKKSGTKPKIFTFDNLTSYFDSYRDSLWLINEESEIVVYLIVQWVTIVLAYLLWMQIFKWVPQEVWDAIDKAYDQGNHTPENIANFILLIWSITIVIAASYPLAICNAAIVAVHNLRMAGKESTFYKSLALAMRYVGSLWVFSSVDNWITVNAILDRLPKKNNNRNIYDELEYYAWKIATLTVVPSLLNGRGFIGAGQDAITIYKKNPVAAMSLRFGYSLVCWAFGVVFYIASFSYMCMYSSSHFTSFPGLYQMIFITTVPLAITVAITTLILRPPFLLGLAKLYTDNIEVRPEDLEVTEKPMDLILDWKTIVFLFIVFEILLLVFFGEKIGFTQWITELMRSYLK